MATRLKNLRFTEVAVVDEPANEGARFVLTKRNEGDRNVNTNIDIRGGAHLALEGIAAGLRKANPDLTPEQAFAKACAERPDILALERQGARRDIAKAYAEPEAADNDDINEVVDFINAEKSAGRSGAQAITKARGLMRTPEARSRLDAALKGYAARDAGAARGLFA